LCKDKAYVYKNKLAIYGNWVTLSSFVLGHHVGLLCQMGMTGACAALLAERHRNTPVKSSLNVTLFTTHPKHINCPRNQPEIYL